MTFFTVRGGAFFNISYFENRSTSERRISIDLEPVSGKKVTLFHLVKKAKGMKGEGGISGHR